MSFVNLTQCDYGAKQTWTPIYSGGRPKASRTHGHECFEQPLWHNSIAMNKKQLLQLGGMQS
jgi:hypothetical protein